MQQLMLTINRDQAGALAQALSVFVRLCRRDMRVLSELVQEGFIPVFDRASSWRAKPATADVVAEFSALVPAIADVIGGAMPESEELTGNGGAAESLARRLPAVLQEQGESLVVVCSLVEAQAAAEALDAYARLGIGQIMIVEEMVRFGTVRASVCDAEAGLAPLRTVSRCEALFDRLRAALNFSSGQSLGVGNRSVKIEAHRAWEVCKVVRQALAIHRDPAPAFRGVHYDGLDVLRYTQDPMPVASIQAVHET